LGQLIALIVAVVVTAGVGSWAATATAKGGLGLGAFGAGALGAAAGSVAGQITGIALGVQQDFDFKGLALAAISGGIGGELANTSALGGTSLGQIAARAAITNAATQAIGVATGLQDKFSWRGVAASGIAAGVGQAVSNAIGVPTTQTGAVAKAVIVGLARSVTSAAVRGGKVSFNQIATDAFGNALGESLADSMTATQGVGPWSEKGYRSGLDVQSDAINNRREQAAIYGAQIDADDFTENASGDRLTLAPVGSNDIPGDEAGIKAWLDNKRAQAAQRAQALRAAGIAESNAITARLNRTSVIRETVEALPVGMGYLDDGGHGTTLPQASNPYANDGYQPDGSFRVTIIGTGNQHQANAAAANFLDNAQQAASTFEAFNNARVASGQYDRWQEVGEALFSGDYAQAGRHFMFSASPEARAELAARNAPQALSPEAARLQASVGSPIGTIAALAGRAVGATQATQDNLLRSFGWVEQFGGSITGQYKRALTPGVPAQSTYSQAAGGAGAPTGPRAPRGPHAVNQSGTQALSAAASRPPNSTRSGVLRTNPADWRALREHWDALGYSEILSTANRSAISKGRTPRVDDQWIAVFPEDAGLRGERISMHHIGGSPVTIPLPASRHLDAHMPGGFRHNPGGPGSALPAYPTKP
jgi:hypothetical protein